jgi:hypothetical protein
VETNQVTMEKRSPLKQQMRIKQHMKKYKLNVFIMIKEDAEKAVNATSSTAILFVNPTVKLLSVKMKKAAL